MSYVEEGTRARKTASTLQNPSSSRSHALLTVALSPSSKKNEGPSRGGSSKLHLVDLAGSESAATCSGVHRLKEGANINKSLVALGNVISALAERSSTGNRFTKRFIPYRDSSLTWLLKDALGGNATTIMLATISPASGSYNETAHTLRFAQRAQSVVNRPVVNEDPVAKIIRELRAEVARLKSLLLEKNVDPERESLCCCKGNQSEAPRINDNLSSEQQGSSIKNPEVPSNKVDEEKLEEGRCNVQPIRKFSSTENLTNVRESSSTGSIKRFGSFEVLSSKDLAARNCKRARVTELNDDEDDVVNEINESVFVDIPTLVAVLIKPDDSLQESSSQIEEICSDEVQEDSIDVEFIEANGNVESPSEKPDGVDQDECRSSVNTCNGGIVETSTFPRTPESLNNPSRVKPKGRISKQNSIDIESLTSNLHHSKRFGSVEALQRRKESFFPLERSHTNLEKRAVVTERTKKLNNIREIEDQKANGRPTSLWKTLGGGGSKEQLQRKGSNDSDKSLKDSAVSRIKNFARKSSFEGLKRKTSKDSSSSSSKEEQILISSLTRDKVLRRKGSLEQEPSAARTHTPIQRAKRAEIVAAVTERLYSSRKHTEDIATASCAPGSGVRSPPEGTDVKLASSAFTTRAKLQEISRKMLSKRRKVCVDTQTEVLQTVRVKDTASSTEEEPKIVLQDVGVLTENREAFDCGIDLSLRKSPVRRVKEIATSTDRPRTDIIKYKDAEILVNDLEDFEGEFSRNDSGISSEDTQNYAESNSSGGETSELCLVSGEGRMEYVESSTNTLSMSRKSAVAQTKARELMSEENTTKNRGMMKTENIIERENQRKFSSCDRQCCKSIQENSQPPQLAPIANSERNVISISIPDMISITIESTNALESRIAVIDGTEHQEDKMKSSFQDKGFQTERNGDSKDLDLLQEDSGFSFKDLSTKSTANQTDRVFRIENIFQDPKSSSKTSRIDAACDAEESVGKKSVTFTNSLGTSSVPDTRESATEMEGIQDEEQFQDFQRRLLSKEESAVSTLEGFGSRRQGDSSPRKRSTDSSGSWKTWKAVSDASRSGCYKRQLKILSWQKDKTLTNSPNPTCENSVSCTKNLLTVEDSRESRSYYEAPKQSFVSPSVETFSIKSPSKIVKVESRNVLDHEHNFSDDSLDYNEEDDDFNETTKLTLLNAEGDSSSQERENRLCPPDVVAHTKKENPKPSIYVENVENVESSNSDFDGSHVDFPKKKLNDSEGVSVSIHDYKSLILGNPIHVVDENEETPIDSTLNRSGKKRVSFLNNDTPDDGEKRSLKNLETKQVISMPKSIIKRKKKKNSEEFSKIAQSNDETDDSDEKIDYQRVWPGKSVGRLEESSSEEALSKEGQDSKGSSKELRESERKKVRFSERSFKESSDDSSDNDERISINDEDAMDSVSTEKRNILKQYLDEAVIFMRNMNCINEYMSATNMFDRYFGRKKGGSRRRGCVTMDQEEYVEFEGRRVSLKDDTDEYLKQEDDIVIPTESYEKCLKGIERLENCIDKVNRHNDLLQEKYSIDFAESTGAKHGLALSGSDSRTTTPRQDFTSRRVNETLQRHESRSIDFSKKDDATDLDDRNNNTDDLKRTIFEQLMNAADLNQYTLTRKNRQRRGYRMSDLRCRSPTTSYSKFRGRYGCTNNHDTTENQKFFETLSTRASDSTDFDSTEEEDSSVNLLNEPRLIEIESQFSTKFKDAGLSRLNLPSTRLSNAKPINYLKEGRTFDEEDSTEIDSRETPRGFDEGQKYLRRTKDASSRPALSPSEKLKYPGSPRARFLELLRERRRIVESSRGTSAS